LPIILTILLTSIESPLGETSVSALRALIAEPILEPTGRAENSLAVNKDSVASSSVAARHLTFEDIGPSSVTEKEPVVLPGSSSPLIAPRLPRQLTSEALRRLDRTAGVPYRSKSDAYFANVSIILAISTP
jgi:hypothetical protein